MALMSETTWFDFAPVEAEARHSSRVVLAGAVGVISWLVVIAMVSLGAL